MNKNEIIQVTEPHYAALERQGELRDNEVIDDKQLQAAQKPVTTAANNVIKLRLKQEDYRAVWAFKDTLRKDKWAHRDKVRQMKKDRKAERQAAKAAEQKERKDKLLERKKAKENARKKPATPTATAAPPAAEQKPAQTPETPQAPPKRPKNE